MRIETIGDATLYHADIHEALPALSSNSVQCCVTSPPYWGLRDYNVDGQMGLENTPEEYIDNMVNIFRLVRNVLKDDGTLWLNLGDSYTSSGRKTRDPGQSKLHPAFTGENNKTTNARADTPLGLKPKDLIGIPWRVALALQADGWYLRSDIIWAKPNPMPESVLDRPTRSHEYIFLLSKSAKYYYGAEAIKVPIKESSLSRIQQKNFNEQKGGDKDYGPDSNRSMRKTLKNFADKQRGHSRRHTGFNDRWDQMSKEEQGANGANKRDVWTVATQPYAGAHFATFPMKLIEPCILAGSRAGDVVLDPFMGSGASGEVALQHGRKFVGIELNGKYIYELAIPRIDQAQKQFRMFA